MYTVPTVQEGTAIRAIELFAAYDSLRLRTYREREGLHARIRKLQIGAAQALRFDDVGYFNRVYAPDAAIANRLAEVEEHYRGCPFAAELVGPPEQESGLIDRECRRRGWVAASRYAWMHARIADVVDAAPHPDLEICPPEPAEQEGFLRTYLRAFGAAPAAVPAAILNMRHLFDLPEISFVMAWQSGQPVGVGMIYCQGDAAVLCAGATLPEQRRQGCHSALLHARIQLAAERGCQELFSFAAASGQSHANMERLGLGTVGITSAWRFLSGVR